MKTIFRKLLLFLTAAYAFIPDVVLAAGGEKVGLLVVVADTRRVAWAPTLYILDLYNTNPFMLGLWCVIITAALGCSLGLITDFFMKRTGIDLSSRKLVEH